MSGTSRAQALPEVAKVDGHVMSTEAEHLVSGYLRDILKKGKKYRLQQPVPTVLRRLEEGLAEYVDYKKKKDPDPVTHAALDRWAEAVRARAKARLAAAARDRPPDPDGYPGLREQIQAAKRALVFGPEDRAPHGFFFACGRWYADKLNARLGETGAFVVETSTRDAILGGLRSFNDSLGLKHHDRLPYLYGAWKAKKKAFRWIAGTSRVQDETPRGEGEDPDTKGPPANALSEVGRVLVKALQHVLRSLRTKDRRGRSHGGPTRYWVAEDVQEVVEEFRTRASVLAAVPWATYDFTTMYEALSGFHSPYHLCGEES